MTSAVAAARDVVASDVLGAAVGLAVDAGMTTVSGCEAGQGAATCSAQGGHASGSFTVDSEGVKLTLKVVADRPQAKPALKIAVQKTSCPRLDLPEHDPQRHRWIVKVRCIQVSRTCCVSY